MKTPITKGWNLTLALGCLGMLSAQTEVIKFTAGDSAPGDQVGAAVAVNARYALAGAREDRAPGANVGSVYVFDRTTGQAMHKLTAGDAAVNDLLGEAVAVLDDLALVGAPNDDDFGSNSGSVYLFDLSDGSELTKLTPDDGRANAFFGNAVACSSDYLLIAAREDSEQGTAAGAVYVFDPETWEQERKLTASDAYPLDTFGYAVTLSGDLAIVGTPFANGTKGAAYVFDLSTGTEERKFSPAGLDTLDSFGTAVAATGGKGVIGAPLDDDAGQNAGAVYVIDLASGEILHKLTAADGSAFAFFGSSIAVEGTVALIGARGDGEQGAAYLFDLDSGDQVFKLVASDGEQGDEFGFSSALAGDTILIGAHKADELTGAAYLFSRKPLVLGPVSPGGVEIRFAGVLQFSPDLKTWQAFDPQPVSPFNLDESTSPRFLRAQIPETSAR